MNRTRTLSVKFFPGIKNFFLNWNPNHRFQSNMSHNTTGAFSGGNHRLGENIKIDLNNDLSRADVFFPGFGVDNLDRAVRIDTWRLARMGEAGRITAYGMMGDIGTNTLYQMGQLVKERLIFLVSNCTYISPNFYKPMLLCQPVKYSIYMLNIGKSSIAQIDEISLVSTGEILTQSVVKLVMVDRQTRKARNHPQWFVDLFKNIANTAPKGIAPSERFVKMHPPKGCYIYKTRIEYSDMDYYFHTNQASYVRIVCDAATSASVDGKLQVYSGDLSFQNIKKMHFMYQGESTVNDNIDVLVWQEKDHPEIIFCQLQKDDKPIFLAKFLYEIPQKPKASQL